MKIWTDIKEINERGQTRFLLVLYLAGKWDFSFLTYSSQREAVRQSMKLKKELMGTTLEELIADIGYLLTPLRQIWHERHYEYIAFVECIKGDFKRDLQGIKQAKEIHTAKVIEQMNRELKELVAINNRIKQLNQKPKRKRH